MSPAQRGDDRQPTDWTRRLVAEAFGTFALVFVAVGADTMAAVSGGEVSAAARAVAPGLMVAALIYSIGDVSGAHLNPAVSLAFSLKRLFPYRWLVGYWAAQVIRGAGGRGPLANAVRRCGASRRLTPHVPAATAIVLEVILTWLLVTVILGTADRHRIVGPEAALAVGATIALCGLIAGPIEGASMNLARSLAPARRDGLAWRPVDLRVGSGGRSRPRRPVDTASPRPDRNRHRRVRRRPAASSDRRPRRATRLDSRPGSRAANGSRAT